MQCFYDETNTLGVLNILVKHGKFTILEKYLEQELSKLDKLSENHSEKNNSVIEAVLYLFKLLLEYDE